MELKAEARHIFDDARKRVGLDRVMRQYVHVDRGILQLGELSYEIAAFRRIVLVAIGKAAVPMTEEVLLALANVLSPTQSLEGVAVGATAPGRPDRRVRYFMGSHPLPDERSVAAADTILELLSTCDEQCLVLLLLSGGASSMVEKPLLPSMSIEDAATLHRALVHSGLPIAQMNALRKHFSAVKGGRLAVAAGRASLCTMIVSDVPPAAMDVVGSGPSLPDSSTSQECRDLVRDHAAALRLTDKLRLYFEDPALAETPKRGDAALANGQFELLLSSDDLCKAAQESAEARGFAVTVDNRCDEWDYRDAAQYLLDRAEALRQHHAQVCLLSAGEISVPLGTTHGQGGRNQHFVLECVRLARERGADVTVLSAGSDGVDGNSPAAGAVADSRTAERAAALGLSVEGALADFDSYNFFSALGDALVTGPTGNNLRDLRILLVTHSPNHDPATRA